MNRIWKFGADVDTDQMVPGRYAPYMRPDRNVGEAAFIEARPDFNVQAIPGDLIVAGENFGCGSSREYAPLALKERGVAGIIASSFARIFFRNAVNLGIPLMVAPDLVEQIDDGDAFQLSMDTGRLEVNGQVYRLPALDPFAQALIEAGGVVAYVRRHGRLPVTEGCAI